MNDENNKEIDSQSENIAPDCEESDEKQNKDDFSSEDDFFDEEEDDFFTPTPKNTSEDKNIQDSDVDDEENLDDKELKEQKKQIKAENRQKRKDSIKKFWLKIRIPLITVIIIIICAFIAFFAYAFSTISSDKIMNNVYIEDLYVGGLTYDEAVASINASYMFKDSEITLVNGDKTFTIKGSDIGLEAIPEETANKAFNYCKTGNIFTNGYDALMLMFKPHVIVPTPKLDTARLDEKLNEFGKQAVGERKQHYVEFGDDGMATVYSGSTGYDENPETARNEVIEALSNEQFTNISVTYNTAPPDEMTIEAFDALVYKDPVDARYEVADNNVTVVPGETGRYINKDEAMPLLQNVYEGCQPVKIPYYVSQPAKTAAMLQEKLFADTLGSYSTSYGSSDSNRRANIARAAELINGTVLAPGEVFSFNDTVGYRTKENGFHPAKEYVDGQSVDGIGGGTCQVSSTLYSAVLYADMSIVERLNHMMTVGYIPLGQDATVADDSVDFKFKNSSDYPVKIHAYTSGATITIDIIGTQWDPPRTVKISSTTTKQGENTVVYSTRYVYAGDELISTDKLNSSTYVPPKPASTSSN